MPFLLFVVFTGQARHAAAQTHKTENIIIVTLDGMRWQEVFGGIDTAIVNNLNYTRDKDNLKSNFWADDVQERRKKLFPFLWTTVAQQGCLLGNRNIGNKVNVANRYQFSYPGYNEIFTGYPDTLVNSNDKILNKNVTVLEYLNKQKGYAGKVAAFTTWDVFPYIFNKPRSGLYINSAGDTLEPFSPAAIRVNSLAKIAPRPLGCRPDLITYLSARAYLEAKKPKLLYMAFLETDYAGHDGLYDVYTTSAHAEDAMIAELWNQIQTMPEYKNKTTLIITCDHGRGDHIKDQWMDHGVEVADSGGIWIAALGPDTPATGEATTQTQTYQKQIAPTISKLFGVNFAPIGGAQPVAAIVQ